MAKWISRTGTRRRPEPRDYWRSFVCITSFGSALIAVGLFLILGTSEAGSPLGKVGPAFLVLAGLAILAFSLRSLAAYASLRGKKDVPPNREGDPGVD